MIFRYLSGSKVKCICLGGGNVPFIGYSDSDYAGYPDSING